MEPVKVSVRSELEKIIEELQKVRDAASETSDAFKDTGKNAGDELKKRTKETESFVGNMRNMVRRAADQMKQDFKSLAAVNALGDALKISNQFRGSIKEAVSLNDTMRKLGATLGVATSQQSRFLANMVDGLSKVGLGSEVAQRSLESLAETPVRGEENITAYAKEAGLLARSSGQQGQEGRIAAGMSGLLMSRGVNPNDLKEMKKVSDDLARVRIATGKGPTETLDAMTRIYDAMPKDLRKTTSTRQLSQLGVMGMQGGPGATKFLEEFLKSSPIERMKWNAMGFGGVVKKDGIDMKELQKAMKGQLGMIGGDPRKAAQILGISDEAAEGMVRLSQNMDRVITETEKLNGITEEQADSLKKTMGFGEAFKANIERVKGAVSGFFFPGINKATEFLGGASESTAGAAAVTLGGGALAALLAGYGLKGIGKGMGLGGIAGSVVKGSAASAVTGKDVQPVYVVNAGEIAAGGAAGDLMGKAGGLLGGAGKLGMLGKLGLYGAAAGVGIWGGNKLNESLKGTAVQKEWLDPFFDRLIQIMGMGPPPIVGGVSGTSQPTKQQQVYVRTDDPRLRLTSQPTRGGSN